MTASHGAQNQNSLLETKLFGFVWKFNLRSIKRLKGTRRVSVSRNPPVARLSINCLTRTMASSEFDFVRVKTSLQCVYPIIAEFPCWLRACATRQSQRHELSQDILLVTLFHLNLSTRSAASLYLPQKHKPGGTFV